MPSHLELTQAVAEHQSILENLLELYIHDFSEFLPIDLGDDGRFGYKDLHLYWDDPRRRAFLAKWDGKLAGFALIKRSSEVLGDAEVWDMAEFFVLRGYRRRGMGARMAEELWRQCPGRWQVRVRSNNSPACRFWESTIAGYIGRPAPPANFHIRGVSWHAYLFETRA